MIKLHSLKGLVMWYLHRPGRIKGYIARNKRNEERICQKDTITVVFFASNVSMWHYQGLYEEMLKYPRFRPFIVLSPFTTFEKEYRIRCVEELRVFFEKKGVSYIDYDTDKMKGYDVKGNIRPDLLFYTQPYLTVYCKEHRYYRFNDSLLAYYPYFFRYSSKPFAYNEDYNNRAWRLYYETEMHKNDAAKTATIGDYNVRVVGYPNADEFLKKPKDVWKAQNEKKKRVIWAPHFTLQEDAWSMKSNFLWLYDIMLNLAEKYKDSIQFAFKPHPRLYTELCKYPGWGKEKANSYYEKWEKGSNCQLEIGDFIDLFMTSDAMIHDCGSFSVEYMYTGKPVMFISKDIMRVYNQMSEFGRNMIEQHYIAKEEKDIVTFLEEIVLGGVDPKLDDRQMIKQKYLFPQNGKTVAANTMDDIITSLQSKN